MYKATVYSKCVMLKIIKKIEFVQKSDKEEMFYVWGIFYIFYSR